MMPRGYERIRGELLKLGHRVSSTSIRNLLRRHRVPPAPRRTGLSWRRFLRAHGRAILACDYFTVDTAFLKRLYVLFFSATRGRALSRQHRLQRVGGENENLTRVSAPSTLAA